MNERLSLCCITSQHLCKQRANACENTYICVWRSARTKKMRCTQRNYLFSLPFSLLVDEHINITHISKAAWLFLSIIYLQPFKINMLSFVLLRQLFVAICSRKIIAVSPNIDFHIIGHNLWLLCVAIVYHFLYIRAEGHIYFYYCRTFLWDASQRVTRFSTLRLIDLISISTNMKQHH